MGEYTALFERAAARYAEPQLSTEGLLLRRERKQRNKRIRAGVVALVVTVLGTGALLRALPSGGVPADDPRSPFLGSWVSTDDDGSTQTMTILAPVDDAVEIEVHDDAASVCSDAPSTMVGTGRLEGSTELVIGSPVLTCDDGSQPEALSGPPLQDQLRDLTFVHDPEADALTDNWGTVWAREGAEDPIPDPVASGGMWPQTSLEEVRRAQERADAGTPAYTWQVDPELVNGADPHGAEIFERFLREKLGWESFTPFGGHMYLQEGGNYDGVQFLRCAPGRSNPLSSEYPDMPSEVRGCAPTLGDFRWETVWLTLEQLARTDPSGIWVVSHWELLERGEPYSLFDLLYPDEFVKRQVEQEAPPPDPEVTATLQAFLDARVAGAAAETYVHPHDAEEPSSLPEEVPLMYATTGGIPYERSEIERVQGPVWPSGWSEFEVRLFAEDGTVVEQSFVVVRDGDGRLGLVYGSQTGNRRISTTEDGRSVPVPYSMLDGEVTFAAAPPWGDTTLERSFTVLGGVGRGSASQFTMFAVVADPRTAIGCEAGPVAADAEALVRRIRSNPDFEATAPVAVRVGAIDAVRMDVVALGRPEAGVCMPLVLDRLWAGEDTPMRLYLLDLPEGMSARILAIGIVALDSEFERVVEAAAPVLDSIEFHTR
jgi:hypothetical protein